MIVHPLAGQEEVEGEPEYPPEELEGDLEVKEHLELRRLKR